MAKSPVSTFTATGRIMCRSRPRKFPQRLRVEPQDYPERIKRRLIRSLAGWRDMLAGLDQGNAKRIQAVEDIIKIYEREVEHFDKRAN